MPTIVRHKGTTDRKACQAASESTADMTLHNYRVSDAVQSGWIAGTPLNRGVLSMQCGVGSGADSATDESIGSDEEGELRKVCSESDSDSERPIGCSDDEESDLDLDLDGMFHAAAAYWLVSCIQGWLTRLSMVAFAWHAARWRSCIPATKNGTAIRCLWASALACTVVVERPMRRDGSLLLCSA